MTLQEVADFLASKFELSGISTERYLIKPDGMLSLFFIMNFNGKWNKSYDYDTNVNSILTFEYQDDPAWNWSRGKEKAIITVEDLEKDILSTLTTNHMLGSDKASFILKR